MSHLFQRVPGRPNAFAVDLPDLPAVTRLGQILAAWFGARDTITLSGDLGAGKTEMARAIVRAYAGERYMEVPSPTFPIVLGYDVPRGRVVHADLYRIVSQEELDEIGWDEMGDDAFLLVEWADRAAGRLAPDHLDIALGPAPDLGPEARRALLTGYGAVGARLQRLALAEDLIAASGFGDAERRFLQGDASARSYTRLILPGRSAILMNAPPQPDGPPVARGLPYSRLVHLAEDIRPFVAMDRALIAQGLSAPLIEAADLDAGLLVIEDLGNVGVAEGNPPAPVRERYELAVELLAELHGRVLPGLLPVVPRVDHALARYDKDAFLAELDLMLDWYLPARERPVDAVVREEYRLLWRGALVPVLAEPKTWVLRDFHSPNLIWLEAREGLRKVGLIDFQDAVLGPAAYDLVSLTQDARVDVPEALELHLVSHYVKARRAQDPAFDTRAFARSYATMGAQRASKILGIFTRLDRRDGKPHYLKHLPRIRRHLARSLGHPDLRALKTWYEAVLPPKDLVQDLVQDPARDAARDSA
ncbi:tRNA (adenosine(37)-N6)-threonylcarbamoyltransferase complex ATPase subunit type 1 TsaE [Xanthobacter sp. KR7-225]|uniref:tRNA (adenosine(37)-N6)-threonylcarbamoyltransferase complex ATPase subunit type 1 TsaE n=1 Tax=Xanthobacter sp. KR7-225 TaxID=3156613 RepID=UPI0032B4D38A